MILVFIIGFLLGLLIGYLAKGEDNDERKHGVNHHPNFR
jgi:hypothetical protein